MKPEVNKIPDLIGGIVGNIVNGLDLPILDVLPEIVETLKSRHELVLQAPPGAGKTTCVPLALLGQDWLAGQKILMLEPRRLAARSAAHRMAELLGETVAETVGYRMRLDTRVGPNTRIEVITEGILCRMLQNDPSLEGVGLVIFDEFHERNLDSDLALSLALKGRELFRESSPLKLLVMSATLASADISSLLADAPVIISEGRSYPVEVIYGQAAKPRERIVDRVVVVVQKAIKENANSSILVFLPGQGEIRRCETTLNNWLAESGFSHIAIMPLYGNLTLAQQQAAITPVDPASKIRQKVVLATNIAETSLTIEGVDVVIDAGLMRESIFDPATAMMRLQTRKISMASSIQRMGRAGRLRPGRCYRLWSESQQSLLQAHINPEILSADLSSLALQIIAWGVNDPADLDWLDNPPKGAWSQAVDLLTQLGALEGEGSNLCLTARGEVMNQLPVHPRLAQLLIAGTEIGQARIACLLAGVLSERDPISQADNQDQHVEIEYRIDLLLGFIKCPGIYRGWLSRVKQLAKQYEQQLRRATQGLVKRLGPEEGAPLISYLLACGFPDRIARKRHKGGYQLANGRSAGFQSANRMAKAPWLVIAEVSGAYGGGHGGKGDVIRSAVPLDVSLFDSDLKHLVRESRLAELDKQSGRFMAERRFQVGALLLRSEVLQDISESDKNAALLAYVREAGLACLNWNPALRQWQCRVAWVKSHDASWPDLSDTALLDDLEQWLLPYLSDIKGLKALRRLDLSGILMSRLDWQQQQRLQQLTPEKITVPSGSRIVIDYDKKPPVLAVKLQEMFGLNETPSILDGAVKLSLHLLSPARRPLQVTSDLAGFWQSSYFDVRKDMRGRYPKHPWPEDPMQAVATSRVKKKPLAKKPLANKPLANKPK